MAHDGARAMKMRNRLIGLRIDIGGSLPVLAWLQDL